MYYDHSVPLHGRLRRRVRAFYEQWGDILQVATGTFLIVMAIAIVAIALSVRHTSANAQTTAHAACIRTRHLAPPLVNFYVGFNGTRHALDPKILAEYKATIPTSCP